MIPGGTLFMEHHHRLHFGPRKSPNFLRAPIKEGDEIEVSIISQGQKGDGIAKVNGFVIFIPKAKQNESVRIKITKVLRKVGFGEIIKKTNSLNNSNNPHPKLIDQKDQTGEKMSEDKCETKAKKEYNEKFSSKVSDEPTEAEESLLPELENEDDREEQEDEEDKDFYGKENKNE